VTLLSTRIVEGEKIAIQAPCREFGEMVKADPRLNQEYIDLSNRLTSFFAEALLMRKESQVIRFAEYSSWEYCHLPVIESWCSKSAQRGLNEPVSGW